MAAMEAELKLLQEEQRKLLLQQQLREIKRKNALLRDEAATPKADSTTNRSAPAATEKEQEVQMPSLDELRKMAVDQLLCSNPTAAAIVTASSSDEVQDTNPEKVKRKTSIF